MNLVACLLMAWLCGGQAYSEKPRTDPVVFIRWNNSAFFGFFTGRNQIVAITTDKESGTEAIASTPEVICSVRVCSGGDYCSETPSFRTAAKLLRKHPGPKQTSLLLLSVSEVPPAELTPYHIAETANDDDVHFRINWGIPAEGKLSAEDEGGVRTVLAIVKADCPTMIGIPVLQGHGEDLWAGDVAGAVAGCDSAGNLEIVTASKLREMLFP